MDRENIIGKYNIGKYNIQGRIIPVYRIENEKPIIIK